MPEPLLATPEELEAIQLRWRMQNPDAPADGGPTPEESLVLLGEIRERMRAIEEHALAVLRKSTRVQSSISGNSKYLLLLLYGVVGLGLIAGLVVLIASR